MGKAEAKEETARLSDATSLVTRRFSKTIAESSLLA